MDTVGCNQTIKTEECALLESNVKHEPDDTWWNGSANTETLFTVKKEAFDRHQIGGLAPKMKRELDTSGGVTEMLEYLPARESFDSYARDPLYISDSSRVLQPWWPPQLFSEEALATHVADHQACETSGGRLSSRLHIEIHRGPCDVDQTASSDDTEYARCTSQLLAKQLPRVPDNPQGPSVANYSAPHVPQYWEDCPKRVLSEPLELQMQCKQTFEARDNRVHPYFVGPVVALNSVANVGVKFPASHETPILPALKRYKCLHCPQVFHLANILEKHEALHATVTCRECSVAFGNKREFNSHRWYFHTKCKCRVCGVFVVQKDFKQHRESHD